MLLRQSNRADDYHRGGSRTVLRMGPALEVRCEA